MPPDSKTPRDSPARAKTQAGAARRERLSQALRDNLKKRKAQQRQRREGQGPGADGTGEEPGGEA